MLLLAEMSESLVSPRVWAGRPRWPELLGPVVVVYRLLFTLHPQSLDFVWTSTLYGAYFVLLYLLWTKVEKRKQPAAPNLRGPQGGLLASGMTERHWTGAQDRCPVHVHLFSDSR